MPMSRSLRILALTLVLAAAALVPEMTASTADTTDAWPQYGQSAAHLNTNPADQVLTPKVIASLGVGWKDHFGTISNSGGGPVSVGGFTYVPGSDGVLSAFRAAGCGAADCEPLWRGSTPKGDGFIGTPAVASGVVLAGATDHVLYAFPAVGCGRATCAPVWTAAVTDTPQTVAVANGTAYVGDFGGRVYAFAAAGCGHRTCNPLWTWRGTGEQIVTAPAVGRGSVYVGTVQPNARPVPNGRLVVLPAAGCGAKTCDPIWTADLQGPDFTFSPVLSGTTLFAGSDPRFGAEDDPKPHLFAFPAGGCGRASCLPLRSYDLGDTSSEGTPAVADGTIFVRTHASTDPNLAGVVQAFPAAGCGSAKVCEPLWTGVNESEGAESDPVVVGHTVLIGVAPVVRDDFSTTGGVYAFSTTPCGTTGCRPQAFLDLHTDGSDYLGEPLAVTGDQVMMVSDDTERRSHVYVLTPPR
jgi:outer membrane protein assembly factor BamB